MKFDRLSRLLSRKDFEKVFKASRLKGKGFCLRRPSFIVYQDFEALKPRLGISIPKKIVRKASKRNRMKRCLREYFRIHQKELAGDIVVRWTRSPEKIDFDTLVQPLNVLREKRLQRIRENDE